MFFEKCVMCNKPAVYHVIVKYKSGPKTEYLCEHCFKINSQLEMDK